jgi:hypothetical protein
VRRAGIAAGHNISFAIFTQFLNVPLYQGTGGAYFHAGETEPAAGIDCRTAFYGEYPGGIFFVIEGINTDTPDVATDANAATADDAQVIIAQEERIVCFERVFFRLIGDFGSDADEINYFLEFTVTVLGAGNAVLADGFATQANIEGFASILAPAVETGMGVFGQYFLKSLFTGFTNRRCFGGYYHAVADFCLACLYITFSINFHHAKTAVSAWYKVWVGTKRRDVYPGFLGCS